MDANKLGKALAALIRPLLAVIFGITACAAFFLDKLNADQWINLAITIISFYFAAKTAENVRK